MKRERLTIVLCVKHLAAEERGRPGYWLWAPRAIGLTCEQLGCPKSAVALGTSRYMGNRAAQAERMRGKKRGPYKKRRVKEADA